jgi:type II restriction enzyme
MNVSLNFNLAQNYSSKSQIMRIVSESWVQENSYCPSCGTESLKKFNNNKPVADFYCLKCSEEFEVKSKKGNLSKKVNDGAYATMIDRITSLNNPNFFFLSYNSIRREVENFFIVPKHFFTPEIIEKRKPLAVTAKRSGWTGCNIHLVRVPELGKIFLVKNSQIVQPKDVLEKWSKSLFLRKSNLQARGWTLDVLNCIDSISRNEFTLDDVYKFEQSLKTKHPDNKFIKDKIRQQLQILRDKGVIEFTSRGAYKKNERFTK